MSCWSPATLERARKESPLASTTLPRSLASVLAGWESALACDSLRLNNIWARGDRDSRLRGPPPLAVAEGALWWGHQRARCMTEHSGNL